MRKRNTTALAAIAGVAAALTAGAATAGAATVTIGQPTLTARTMLTVPVTMSCSPFDPSLTVLADDVAVSVQQAAGRAFATGYGDAYGRTPTPLVPCDGTPQAAQVTLLADPSGPPFHGGPAVFTATAQAWGGIPCPWSPDCIQAVDYQSASAGPIRLTIR